MRPRSSVRIVHMPRKPRIRNFVSDLRVPFGLPRSYDEDVKRNDVVSLQLEFLGSSTAPSNARKRIVESMYRKGYNSFSSFQTFIRVNFLICDAS